MFSCSAGVTSTFKRNYFRNFLMYMFAFTPELKANAKKKQYQVTQV